jgi:hypothetical protein
MDPVTAEDNGYMTAQWVPDCPITAKITIIEAVYEG